MNQKHLLPALIVLVMLMAVPALAVPVHPGDALRLIQKVAFASRKQTYSGTFVYRNAVISETSRIIHMVNAGNEYEQLEVLDGSPREVIRLNDEVRCFLPENKLLIVERRNTHTLFPSLAPGALSDLAEYYDISLGAIDRIAGIQSQLVRVMPRDSYRYGHLFWIDPATGLLLKSVLLSDDGSTLETFFFTELKMQANLSAELIAQKMQIDQGDGWTVQHVESSEVRADDGQWVFRNPLPGFRRVSALKRQLRAGAPVATQIVFSDGLAAISVFLEPGTGKAESSSAFSVGAVGAYRRSVGTFQLIVMGDVPISALRRFGDGIELRNNK